MAFGKTPAHRSRRRASRKADAGTLSSVVGGRTYSVWVGMLHTLVPDGRTHRLSVVVAGMLRQAVHLAVARLGEDAPEASAAASLIQAAQEVNPQRAMELIGPLIERLFRDAEVTGTRVSARGDEYGILDSAVQEFTAWHAMPWE